MAFSISWMSCSLNLASDALFAKKLERFLNYEMIALISQGKDESQFYSDRWLINLEQEKRFL
jgi:hypothetical protein